MAVTMCSSGSVLSLAGSGVSSDLTGAGALGLTAQNIVEGFIQDAEAFVCTATRYNWIDDFAGLNVDVKGMLSGSVGALAAIDCVRYDMSGYDSREEAEDVITVLRDRANWGIKILQEEKNKTFIKGE